MTSPKYSNEDVNFERTYHWSVSCKQFLQVSLETIVQSR